MAEEKEVPQLSPIQPKDVAEKEEWRKKHVRDLDVAELRSIAQAMNANKVIVIGLNDEFKEIMVSVLQLPPHEYEGVMHHLVDAMDNGAVKRWLGL